MWSWSKRPETALGRSRAAGIRSTWWKCRRNHLGSLRTSNSRPPPCCSCRPTRWDQGPWISEDRSPHWWESECWIGKKTLPTMLLPGGERCFCQWDFSAHRQHREDGWGDGEQDQVRDCRCYCCSEWSESSHKLQEHLERDLFRQHLRHCEWAAVCEACGYWQATGRAKERLHDSSCKEKCEKEWRLNWNRAKSHTTRSKVFRHQSSHPIHTYIELFTVLRQTWVLYCHNTRTLFPKTGKKKHWFLQHLTAHGSFCIVSFFTSKEILTKDFYIPECMELLKNILVAQ